MYNFIGLEPRREAMHWQFGEMKFGEMKRNTSNWSNFGILLRRAGLTASAGLSCLKTVTVLLLSTIQAFLSFLLGSM